jgi:hypothetical protein
MTAELPLSAYIDNLRSELETAMKAGEDEELRFFIDKVDLEVTVEVKRLTDTTGKAKFKLFVFDSSLGGELHRSNASTQTIKISLIPNIDGVKGINVSGEKKRVGG